MRSVPKLGVLAALALTTSQVMAFPASVGASGPGLHPQSTRARSTAGHSSKATHRKAAARGSSRHSTRSSARSSAAYNDSTRVTAAPSTGSSTTAPVTTAPITSAAATTGTLKVCKALATGTTAPAGTLFSFSVTGRSTPVTVAPGTCALLLDMPAGPLTVAETGPSGYTVTAIGFIAGTGTSDVTGRSAVATVVAGLTTEVQFTSRAG